MKDFYFVNKMNRSNEYFNFFIKILVLQLHDNTGILQSNGYVCQINYLPVAVIHDSLRTRTDNPDRPILNK
jgi:hypothetical protein